MRGLPEDQRTELVSAARTAIGEELRSVTYFTQEDVEQLYLRDDLEQGADLVGFAENERLGFQSKMIYDGTQLGDYRFTIRAFESGYLVRVIANGRGVWVTTDSLARDRFEEFSDAVEAILLEE